MLRIQNNLRFIHIRKSVIYLNPFECSYRYSILSFRVYHVEFKYEDTHLYTAIRINSHAPDEQ